MKRSISTDKIYKGCKVHHQTAVKGKAKEVHIILHDKGITWF